MLTIKAIIRWERLRNKPFGSLNYQDEMDVYALLYVLFGCSFDHLYTFGEFTETLNVANRNLYEALIGKAERIIKFTAQFYEGNPVNETEGEVPNEKADTIEDIAVSLIASGIDAEYLLEKSTLEEVSVLLKACERKKKEHLENCRLWTFYTVLPHLGKNSTVKSPEKLFPFPWEIEKLKADAIKTMEENEGIFNEFMSGKFNHIMNKN